MFYAVPILVCQRTNCMSQTLLSAQVPHPTSWLYAAHPEEVGQRLLQAPASLVCLELHPSYLTAVWALLDVMQRSFPAARCLILAKPQWADYEMLARELGGLAWLVPPSYRIPLREIIARHTSIPVTPPWSVPEPATLTNRIWANLPWGEFAQSANNLHNRKHGEA